MENKTTMEESLKKIEEMITSGVLPIEVSPKEKGCLEFRLKGELMELTEDIIEPLKFYINSFYVIRDSGDKPNTEGSRTL